MMRLLKENADLKKENEFLKKSCGLLCEKPEVKYQAIKRYSSRFKVSKMCQILGVPRSSYYAWLKRPESERSKRHKQLLEKIKTIHEQSHKIYGSPNITMELRDIGISVSRGTVARLIKQNGIRGETVKKFKATTDSNHNLPIAPNLLNREFRAVYRDQKWVSDITYIGTDEGWLYPGRNS